MIGEIIVAITAGISLVMSIVNTFIKKGRNSGIENQKMINQTEKINCISTDVAELKKKFDDHAIKNAEDITEVKTLIRTFMSNGHN